MAAALTVAAIVLAAGRGSRFGATKQVVPVDGRPMVAHAVTAALSGRCTPVVVVVGHDADRVTAAVPASPHVRVVHNPDFDAGQSTSVRAGIAALADDPAVLGAIVLLADEPSVRATAVRAVAAALRDGAQVVRARYAGGGGHPVGFARTTWPRLAGLRGDEGARQLADLDVVDVDVGGPRPRDVDRPGDLDGVARPHGEARPCGRSGSPPMDGP